MSMPPRANAPQVERSTAKHVSITTAPVFPGDAADGAAVVGASASARIEGLRHGWRVLGILSALMGFASISTDLYLPAMPAMGRSLGADAGTVAWTVSGYLIGFSLGQLLWGPIGDRHGRRLPVAIGPLRNHRHPGGPRSAQQPSRARSRPREAQRENGSLRRNATDSAVFAMLIQYQA